MNGAPAALDGSRRRLEVRERIRVAIHEEGLSPAFIAGQAGVPAGALRAFLKNHPKGDPATEKLEAWLKAAAERRMEPPPKGFAHTSHSKRIYAALRLVHEQGGIGAIYGDPGTGKTATFLAYRSNFPATLLLTASPAVRSPRPLMLRLLMALRRQTPGSLAALAAAAEFHLMKSGRLLIVDEAQHLTYEALDLLRYLVDVSGVRLVLGGNNTVWDRFHAKGAIPFEQLTSRVTVRLHLDAGRMSRGDVEVVVRHALGGARPDCVAWFFERAPHRVGHYRFVAGHRRLARKLAQGRTVTVEHLEMARRMME